MATSSIYQSIRVSDKKSISRLIRALERSQTTQVKDVPVQHVSTELTKEQVQRIFGDDHEHV